ncbi:MAG TPA: hypothetical protein VIZ61_06710 [Solirubrobacterales bacterium]
MKRPALKRLLPLLFAISLAAAVAGCGGGGDDASARTSTALSSCDINGKQQNLGASYVTTIEVAKVSCARAEKVVVAYHGCRRKNGGAGGTCDTAVMGFSCTEGPRQSVPGVQFNATADCRKGDAEIKSAYTQNF